MAYHGLKAKDKSFNAKMNTDFDNSIGSINIIPQDIGRVLLNLINNALYAVNERSKEEVTGYEPVVTVSTKLITASGNPLLSAGAALIRQSVNSIIISVKDNGNGIPQKILDKIFQPFFTTKPTGQGTGLGLSLTYDIVKAHGGELRVETLPAEALAQAGKEGEGSSFTIQLPNA
jgi:signal transduction histidine kinase